MIVDQPDRERPTPLILIAESDPQRLLQLVNILKSDAVEITTAMNGSRAVEKLRDRRPDLALMDADLPGLSDAGLSDAGLSDARLSDTRLYDTGLPDTGLFAGIKRHSEVDGMPLLIIRERVPPADFFARFSGPGIDYITKPVSPEDLRARVRVHMGLRLCREALAACAEELDLEMEGGAARANEIAGLRAALRERDATIEKMAVTDPVTQLYNYRFVMDQLPRKIAESRRYAYPFSIILLDVDEYRAIAARHGLVMGEKILVRVARALQEQIRETDLLARYSGEEFLILLPHTGTDGAYLTADRIRRAIEGMEWEISGLKVTVSGGVSTLSGEVLATEGPDRADRLLYRLIMNAGELLYRARSAGGNRIERDAE